MMYSMVINVEMPTLIGGLLLLVALAAGIIFFLRSRFNTRNPEDLREEYDSSGNSYLLSRNKYPEQNPFKFRTTFLLLGLAMSLGTIFMAFNFTEKSEYTVYEWEDLGLDEEVEVIPPRTKEPPPPPPPPPPPIIEEVPEEEIIEEEEPVFQDQSIDEEVVMDTPEPVEEAPPPPPPPPPPPEPEVEEIFKRVEDMPRFPGCDDLPTNAEKDKCAQQKLLEFMYKNIKYPAIARENNVEGMVVIQFVVDKKGKISEAKVLRDIGAGCGAEALRVVNMMNKMPKSWSPGKQRGKPVKVYFTLPVRFKLQ